MKLVRPKIKSGVTMSNELLIEVDKYSETQIGRLKDSLTFSNPVYETTKKYSPYSRVSVSPYLFYYNLSCRILHVPIGTDLKMLNHPKVIDQRVSVYSSTVPKFQLKLREDQEKAKSSYLSKNGNGKIQGLVQLPTGKGKTILALSIAAELGMKTLVIVHKDDLVNGWSKDITLAYDKCNPGLIKAKKKDVGEFITIATVQTLSRMKDNKPGEYEKLLDQFGLVVCDEAHHCPSSSYEVINDFKSLYRLGLTATPERKDGLTHIMFLYFGGFCYRYESTENEKDILPVTVVRRTAGFLHLCPVCDKTEKGVWFVKDIRADPTKYKLEGSEQYISDIHYNFRPKLVYSDYSDIVVRRLKKMVIHDLAKECVEQEHTCIVFLSQKAQVDDYYDAIREDRRFKTTKVYKYYGDNTGKENEEVLRNIEESECSITLCTYSKATEGTNAKSWEVAFLVGSLNDGKNTEQAIGRIRRVKKGKIKNARVYDYRCPNVYSIRNHGSTRDARYRKLKFRVIDDVTQFDSTVRSTQVSSPVSRGYRH